MAQNKLGLTLRPLDCKQDENVYFPGMFFCVSGISALLAPYCSGPGGTTRASQCRWYQLYETNNFSSPDLPNCVTPLLGKLQVGMVILPLFSSEHEMDKGSSQQASFRRSSARVGVFVALLDVDVGGALPSCFHLFRIQIPRHSSDVGLTSRGISIRSSKLHRGFMWAGLDLPSS